MIELLAKFSWIEIKQQTIPGSGIHLSFQVLSDGEPCIVGECVRDNKLYAKAFPFPSDWKLLSPKEIKTHIKKMVKVTTEVCRNTLNLSNAEFEQRYKTE